MAEMYSESGDANWCGKCQANTRYKYECAICAIPSKESRLRYKGDLDYFKEKYPGY